MALYMCNQNQSVQSCGKEGGLPPLSPRPSSKPFPRSLVWVREDGVSCYVSAREGRTLPRDRCHIRIAIWRLTSRDSQAQRSTSARWMYVAVIHRELKNG